MRKINYLIVSIMMLVFASCEKISIDDYSSAIVGWWELVSSDSQDLDLGDGYRWVMEFKDNGTHTHFDNIADYDENGRLIFGTYLYQFQPYYHYWIEEDILCGKDMEDNYCTEFGYPNCECNLNGDSHYTKIIELSNKTLVLELCRDDDRQTATFKRINKPSNIRYR